MKVLVIDDDVVSRMLLMHLIDSCGSFDILEADDGEQAWEQLAQGLRPAICFCDMRMPRLSGMDLLRRVRAAGEHDRMPFILVSSNDDEASVAQAGAWGAAGYIVKPFALAQVRMHLAPLRTRPRTGAYLAEAPHATAQRLGIDGERLAAYLGALHSQLGSAGRDIAAALAQADRQGAQTRIDRLHALCVTLGLHGAAAALTSCAAHCNGAEIGAALADALAAVTQQSDMLKLGQADAAP